MDIDLRVMGRPPAIWVCELAQREIECEEWLDLSEAASRFGASKQAIKRFCMNTKVEGQYKKENGAVRKFLSLKAMQKAAAEYVAKYKY